MQNLQSLIQDILDNRNGAGSASIFTLSDHKGVNLYEQGNDSDPDVFIVNIYIGHDTFHKIEYFENAEKKLISRQTPINDLDYDFNPAIEEATRLWNIYKATNL